MNPLLLLQLFGPLLAGLTQSSSPPASKLPGEQAQAGGIDPAVLTAVIAAMRPAEPVSPHPEITLPRSAAVVATVIVAGFFALLIAIVGLLVWPHEFTSASLASLVVLSVGFGVLISKFGTVVDFLFGSSWGSRSKDAVLAQPRPPSPPVVLPVPVLPPVPPAPPPTPQPGHVLTLRGKMSVFGGPDDSGSGDPNEGLALYDEKQAAARPDLFISVGPGLFRRLNPAAHYVATRWDYKQTPSAWLRSAKVKVTNPKTGKSTECSPVDWGPNVKTGRVADLSPGTASVLGLDTDDEVVVEIPLPGANSVPAHSQAPIPTHPHILSDADLKATFGEFSYSEAGGGRIKINQAWVDANIVTVDIPQLERIGVRSVQFHRKAADALKAVFADIEVAGLIDKLLTFDGSFVPRHIGWDSSRPLSRHSYGIAIDLNAAWNSYGTEGAKPGSRGSNWEITPYFEKHDFAFGGRWGHGSTDAMHFELARKE